MNYSKYYEELDSQAQKRYIEKLSIASLLFDPYLSKDFVSESNQELWPEIEYPDIYNYLINTTSSYTKEQLKAYKSMDGYNFFVQGWVGKVEVLVQEEVIVIKGNVRHSQSISSPLLHPWVAAKKNGTIICAHCTCMAGLGEACSHTAALLFYAEANSQRRKDTSCTSGPCSWLSPSCRKVEYAPISDIDFRTKKRRVECQPSKCSGTSSACCSSSICISSPTDEEMSTFYNSLSQSGTKCAILSLLPQYCDDYIPRMGKGVLPKPLTDLYDKKCFEIASFSELLSECEKVYTTATTMLTQHCEMVEQVTRDQAHSKLWYVYRAGRITASNFKNAVHTSPCDPSISLIKKICYPQSYKFKTKATQWGIDHEQLAITSFLEKLSDFHVNLEVRKCGLMISPSSSYLGASPDGIVKCNCCGKGVLEVKCPYQCKEQSFKDACESSSFCLEQTHDSGTPFRLRINHSYYYQVQLQMKICEVSYCYFVVWSPNELIINKIDYNNGFVETALSKGLTFFMHGVLPELVGRWYSRLASTCTKKNTSENEDSGSDDDKWCYCRGSAALGDMIGCDNDSCSIMWFHMHCLNMDSVPDGEWYCQNCQ